MSYMGITTMFVAIWLIGIYNYAIIT